MLPVVMFARFVPKVTNQRDMNGIGKTWTKDPGTADEFYSSEQKTSSMPDRNSFYRLHEIASAYCLSNIFSLLKFAKFLLNETLLTHYHGHDIVKLIILTFKIRGVCLVSIMFSLSYVFESIFIARRINETHRVIFNSFNCFLFFILLILDIMLMISTIIFYVIWIYTNEN